MMPDDAKWFQMAPAGARCCQPAAASCWQMLPDAPRCCQVLVDAARSSQMPEMIPDAARCCQPRCCQSRWFFLEYYNNYVQELVHICLGWGAPPLVSVQMVVFSVLVQMGEFSSRGSWAKVPEPKLLSWSSESKVIKLKFLMYVCNWISKATFLISKPTKCMNRDKPCASRVWK